MRYKSIVLFLVILINFWAYTQDSKYKLDLNENSFKQLEDSIWANFPNIEKTVPLINVYLDKAKIRNDSIQIARGFNFLARLFEPDKNIKYADSVILYSKNSDHYMYPALGYSLKGYWNYEIGNYEEALDAYVLAYQSALKKENIAQQIETGNAIAVLKNRWGDSKEALEIYKSQLQTIEKQPNYKTDFKEDYLYNLYNTTLSYQLNKYYDSASIFIDKGITESLKLKDTLSYYDFVFTSGINAFYQKDYSASEDSLLKAKQYLDEYSLAIYYYYYGKVKSQLGYDNLAEQNFIKADSLQDTTKDLFPELRDLYRQLIKLNKEKGNTINQLKYLNKLIAVDSLLSVSQNYLNNEIAKEYDIPRLKAERLTLSNELNSSKSSNAVLKIIGFILIVLLIGISLFSYFQYNQRKKYKERFNLLIQEQDPLKIEKEQVLNPDNKEVDIGVPDEIVEDILKKLQSFEAKEKYKDKDLKLSTLASMLETNSTYLSKVINTKKNMSFSEYLKHLRVDYSIKLLKSDKKVRNYTIQAIAQEVGFKSSESFSKAFYGRTGIYPSYFIKNLKKIDS